MRTLIIALVFFSFDMCSAVCETIKLRCSTRTPSIKITRFLEVDSEKLRISELVIKEIEGEVRVRQTGIFQNGRSAPIATSMETEYLNKPTAFSQSSKANDEKALAAAQSKPLDQRVRVDNTMIEYHYEQGGKRYGDVEIDRSSGEIHADFVKGTCVRDERKF